MTLAESVTALTDYLGLDLTEVLEYTNEDPHTGWDLGAGDWPVGSIWRVEGVILYALVRALKPVAVLELGTWHGCSATHMLEALKKNRKKGILTSIDNDFQSQAKGMVGIGDMIPDELRKRWEYIHRDIIEFMQSTDRHFDLIFEDGFHDPGQVATAWMQGRELLNPGGIMVSHDAMHFIVGADVRSGIEAAGIEPLLLDIEPSDCGLAVWRKPDDGE